ncbi:MAG TPA: CpaF family protein [Gemmataceae bacterium]|jgi:pilus assembly protein CpaF|nr:CpaF family protein [Gemmataceae bacterium]
MAAPVVADVKSNKSEVRFQKLKAEIHKRIVETLDLTRLPAWTEDRLRQEVRVLATDMTRTAGELIKGDERDRMVNELMAETFGLGPLEPLMKDPEISDILVNGPHSVYVERRGKLEPTDVVFADDAHVMMIIQRIAARIGRRVDEMSPIVDARLKDGSRVNAIVPPLSLLGPVLSIRRFGVRLEADDLIGNGTMPAEVMHLLQAAVEARISIVVSGGTGSGKTTLLNALSRFIPHDERLVTIEDSAELRLQRNHVIKLETRQANAENQGEVRQRDLVRNALRMRPDRIIVGECRGGEALDMLQAMNTGHEGSMTTVHANDTRDALTRLEMMVMMAGFELPVPVIRHYISSAVTLVVQIARLKGGARKVVRVAEVLGTDPGPYHTKDIFSFQQTGVVDGKAVGEFRATGYVPAFLPRLDAAGVSVKPGLFNERVIG